MRIGFCTLEPAGNDTGPQPCDTSLIRALLALDEPPELVLFVPEEAWPQFETFSRRAEVVAVPGPSPRAGDQAQWQAQQLPALARQHKLEVVHLPGLPAAHWSGPCPALATLDHATDLNNQPSPGWKGKLLDRLVKRQPVPPVDALVATSEFVATAVCAHFRLAASAVAVIPNGIDRQRFAPGSPFEAKTAMDARFDLPEPFFVYNAPLTEPVGNQVSLVAAFNRFKRRAKSSWLLLLAGAEGPGSEKILAAVQASPYAMDIRMVGELPDEDLPTLYRAADAVVFPSLAEVPGLAVVEAMACGCPVISSTRGALREIVGEASSLIDPEDLDDMSSKMAAMAGSLDLRKRWRAAGLTQAAKFDWARTAVEMMELYEKVAALPIRR